MIRILFLVVVAHKVLTMLSMTNVDFLQINAHDLVVCVISSLRSWRYCVLVE